ncbi:MAG: hypothetical protein IPM56_08265 [Ignavibacteriales bacterium]|nr:MAG: hypothetical protein IPM56_08265 [Ignavibacteriales bacterium]
MKKIYAITLILLTMFIISCGEPNAPESLTGDDGGYKIISKYMTAGYAQDVVMKDTLLFIAQGEGGLLIVSIADPNNPKLISSKITDIRGYSAKIDIKDSVIYLAAGNFGVSVVDVGDAYNPEVTNYNLPMKPAKSFYIMGDFLFTCVSELGYNISDISFPTQPDVRATNITPGYCQAVVTSKDTSYLLAACGEMGFAMVDISDFQLGFGTYQVCGWKDTPGYAVDIVRHPDLPIAYIACGTGGLSIVDFSDTADVKLLSNFSSGGYAKEVMYENNKIYLTTETRGMQIFDVTNPSSPVRIGTIPTKYSMGVCADNNYIYIADEIEGLLVIKKP